MESIEPSGTLSLLAIFMDNTYKNQLTFNSEEEQKSFFDSLEGVTNYSDYTYIRHDSTILVDGNYEKLKTNNYCFYNNGYTNERVYAFINRIEYVNENTTRLYIETDVFQTYYFKIYFKQCFVEREHVNSDNIGEWLIPEGLETGDYISTSLTRLDIGHKEALKIIVQVSQDIDKNSLDSTYIGGSVMVGRLYVFDLDTGFGKLGEFIKKYDKAGIGDAIINAWTVSGEFTSPYVLAEDDMGSYIISNSNGYSIDTKVDKITKLADYTPHNNKLLTAPYCYYKVNNGNGGTVKYNPQDFTSSSYDEGVTFRLYGVIAVGCSSMLFPLNYKISGMGSGLSGGKFAPVGWANDTYTNWLTQTAVNRSVAVENAQASANASLASSVLNGIGNAVGGSGVLGLNDSSSSGAVQGARGKLIGGLVGGTLSTVGNYIQGSTQVENTIRSNMASVETHSYDSPQAHGQTNIGDVNVAFNLNDFYISTMTIRSEFAEAIDRYFDMYGYKVNKVKIPNLTGRKTWNYVKTVGCNFYFNGSKEEINVLRNIFDNGCTFWHSYYTALEYQHDNSIES